MKLTLSRAAEFMPATGSFDHEAVAHGYSIDSRTLQPGELFFAVRGERLDGHDYVEAALAKGAVAAVVERSQAERFADKSKLLVVEDSLTALQRLGAAVRRLWGKPLIGVTGSAGKTTTKECIAHVLGTRHRVLKSQGNLNNQFGMPLQLLKLEPEHDVAVIEMGMSHAGEITALAKLAEPDCGVVTMVAPVHLEFFDSIAGIARAKYELIESLPRGRHRGTECGRRIRLAVRPRLSRAGRDVRAAQAGGRGGAEHSSREGRRDRRLRLCSTVRACRRSCRCWASTTSTTRWRGLPWGCNTACRWRRQPNRWPRYQLVTSGEKFSTSREPR